MHDLVLLVPTSDFIEDQFVIPNLNMEVLASWTRKYNPGIKIAVEHMSHVKFFHEISPAKFYGITFTTPQFLKAKGLYRFLRKSRPDSLVVAGGPHVSAVSSEKSVGAVCDVVCRGAGEIFLESLINRYQESPEDRFYEPPSSNLYEDVEFSFDFNLDLYKNWLLVTDYGCPYSCSFCFKMFKKGVYRFPYSFIYSQIDQFCFKRSKTTDTLMKLTSDNVFNDFYWYVPIFEKLKEKGIKYEVPGRLDQVDLNKLKFLKETGCTMIKYGVESGSPRILKLMRKKETLDDMRAGLKKTEEVFGKSYGMYIMVNFPTESKKERQMTVDFIREFSPEFVGVYNLTPYPGTKVWNELIPEDEKEEIEKKDYSLLHHAGLKEEDSKEVKWMKKQLFR